MREQQQLYTPCPYKKCHWFFHSNFYKYVRIFMIFGTQLCKWITIILVNLLRCVPWTSLTWWRNVDVTEIMPFTSRDVAIQFARFESGGLQHLGYPSREGLPFADPWCEGVERKSAVLSKWRQLDHTIIAAAIAQLRSRLVVWMHVFVWMVNILNITLSIWLSAVFCLFHRYCFPNCDRYKHVQSANIVWNVLYFCVWNFHTDTVW